MTREVSGLSKELKPCPFCGGKPALKDRPADKCETTRTGKIWSLICRGEGIDAHAWFYADTKADVLAAWNNRPEVRPVAGEVEGKFWLVLHEPGCVPERKGPWPSMMAAKILREFIKARPTAYIDLLTIGHDGPDVEHGPQALQMLDGRSMSVGRTHNQRTREAHAPHHAALSHTVVGGGSISPPDKPD